MIEKETMQAMEIVGPPGGTSSQNDAEQPTILVVDDSPPIVGLMQNLLTRNGYHCLAASSAEEARKKLQQQEIALVLSDVNMPPGDSGMELIQDIFKNHPKTATILVTGQDDAELGKKAIDLGAYGYVLKPFNVNELLINVANALIRRRLTLENKSYQETLEQAVLDRTRELMDTIRRLETAELKISKSREETIQRLARAAEFRDNETARHIQRMSRYAALLAKKSGCGEEQVELIRTASPMHDIGKIGIDDAILLKPGKHTPKEFEKMKRHAEIGYRILAGSDSDLLRTGATIALSHHEKFDGSGYPKGLTGEDIPLESRITAIADVFDALTSKRVYKPAFSVEKAVEMMTEQNGKHFDPPLLKVFMATMPEMLEIKARYRDE